MSAESAIDVKLPKQRKFIKKPDNKIRDAKLAELNADLKKIDKEISELNQKIEVNIIPQNLLDERKSLTTELNTIIKQQSEIKSKRNLINDQIKSIDSSLKKKITDLNAHSSKNNFKSVEEIDKKINQLDDLIGSGSLKIVDERRYVKEISALRKLRKDFGSIDQQQKSIDFDKNKISELKKSLNEYSNKEIQTKFEQVTFKLKELSAKTKIISDKRDSFYQNRRTLYKNRDDTYSQIKKVRTDFDNQYKKFNHDMEAEKLRREEAEKVYNLTLKKNDLEKEIKLIRELSKKPAFLTEINSIQVLLTQFDPTYVRTEEPILESAFKSNTKASARVIEMPENAVIIKKEQENFFDGASSSKKSYKKGKSSSLAKKFTVEPEIISSLSELSIGLPTKFEDLPTTIDELKTKLADFYANQEEQTVANIAAGDEKAKELETEIKAIDEEIAVEVSKKAFKREEEPVSAADEQE